MKKSIAIALLIAATSSLGYADGHCSVNRVTYNSTTQKGDVGPVIINGTSIEVAKDQPANTPPSNDPKYSLVISAMNEDAIEVRLFHKDKDVDKILFYGQSKLFKSANEIQAEIYNPDPDTSLAIHCIYGAKPPSPAKLK